jgi:hypothetical protein
MRALKKSTPIRVSQQQLSRFGLELVTHDPLVVCCPTCGAEWRPMRLPQSGKSNSEWLCLNGCHQLKA